MRTLTVILFSALCAHMAAQPAAQTAKPRTPAPSATAAKESAASGKQQPPAPGPARPFSFPAFESRKLANGLTIFVVEDHRQPVVSYGLAIDAGSTRVDPKKAGLAELAAGLLRSGGTSTRTAPEIAKLVDAKGGSLSGEATPDAALVHGTWLKANAGLGLELLADVVLNPVFDTKELERMRQQALSGLQVAFSSPESLVDMASSRAVFGQNAYAYPGSGTPETVRGITRDDLVAFHKSYYVPGGAYMAVAGDITPAEAFAQVEKWLGKWAGGPVGPLKSAPAPERQRRVLVIDKADAPQSRIFVGELGIPRNHPDFIPLMLANEVLGGAFTSRLNLKLRAKEGLTYNATSSIQNMRSTGASVIETFTRTEKTAEAIRQIIDVQKGFVTDPATPSEVADAKARLTGLFQLSTETPEAVAERLVTAAVMGLPADYYSDYTRRVMETTPDQVNAAAKKHFDPARTAIVVVGNASQFSKELASFGPVRTVAAADFDPIAPDLVRPKETAPAATAETAAKAKQLVTAAAAAVGGPEALRSVKDMESKSNVVLKTPQGEMKAEASEDILYPDKFRAVLKMPFGEFQQVFDGKAFWMRQGNMVRDMPPQANEEALRTIRIAGAVALLRDALDGKAEIQAVEGGAVLWKQGEMTVRMFFDPESHRVSKLVYRSAGMGGPVEVEHSMSDYRPVGSIQLPYKETMTQAGQPAGERNYTERKVNGGLPAEAFAKPQP